MVWKDGGAVYAKCVDVSTDATVFGPVTVCTDAAVAALDGAATAAVLSGAAPDGSGGSYIWCTATPTRGVTGYGDSLLTHISATGVLASGRPRARRRQGDHRRARGGRRGTRLRAARPSRTSRHGRPALL